MIRIMLTGAGGQLGREVLHLGESCDAIEIFPFTHRELDVTDDTLVFNTVKDLVPHAILHAAAYTKVDLAETNPELACEVNAVGAKLMAAAAVAHGSKLCYISTDYVFDGQTQHPYREHDAVSPINMYGKSKALGEQFVRDICPQSFVVRTSWLYGAYGSNFVNTMLRLAANAGADGIRVVNDQTGSPTWTYDLATFLLHLLPTNAFGIYHASNSGSATWYEFAKLIFELAGLTVPIMPVSTAEFPRPAARPRFSALAHDLSQKRGFKALRPWQDALKAYFQRHHGGISGEGH